ncbi:MAG: hypothetical protein CMD02_02625 [Flavobacteriales bacterium]|nr:hypothetical protein [Flavobacteriales bacterium]|tara:strand:+ start:4078 stop:4287 length:210 start_codon:yes stop_codon:yes gene_type:complete
MSNNRISSLEKIGYQKNLPKGSDINDFEVISITQKNGIKINLYRNKKEKKEIDDTTNFDSSWEVFNSLL